MFHWRALSLIVSIILCISSTSIPAQGAQADDELRQRATAQFGALEPVSRDERSEPAVELGRALFWDTRLSSDGKTACASCHLPEAYGSDARPRSITARGTETAMHSMTVFNTQTAAAGQRWFADRESGRAQAIGSITGSMGFDREEDLLRVLSEQGYADRFAQAFPEAEDPLRVEHYGAALEAYERSLRTPAAFDDWLQGDDQAIDEEQKAGLSRFLDMGCAACHGGELFGGGALQKFGLLADYWEHTGSSEVHDGLMTMTGDESDRYVFRVAPLRNVAATAPYFHDASVQTLEDAVKVMARVQLGQTLDEDATGEIVRFLESLTGEVPEHFSAPEGVPGPE